MAGFKKGDINNIIASIEHGRTLGERNPVEFLGELGKSNQREYAIELICYKIEQLDCLPAETKEMERLVTALSKMDVTDQELESLSSRALRKSVKADLDSIDSTRKNRQEMLSALRLGAKVEITPQSGAFAAKGKITSRK